jgi:hypothetical protein
VDVIELPTDKPWGLREMQVRDPDGLRIVTVEVPETPRSGVAELGCVTFRRNPFFRRGRNHLRLCLRLQVQRTSLGGTPTSLTSMRVPAEA